MSSSRQRAYKPRPHKIKDIAGQRFANLTALSFSHMDEDNKAMWRVRCDCGRECVFKGNALQSGNTKSCGCRGKNFFPRNRKETLIESLLSNITMEPNSGCWLWTHSHNQKLYGKIRDGHGRQLYTHRVAYEHFVGPIPKELVLDHICRVTLCCNPKHLRPLGRIENWQLGDPWAWQRNRTHCPKGHPVTPENERAPSAGCAYRCKQCLIEFRDRNRAKWNARARERRALARVLKCSQSPG